MSHDNTFFHLKLLSICTVSLGKSFPFCNLIFVPLPSGFLSLLLSYPYAVIM